MAKTKQIKEEVKCTTYNKYAVGDIVYLVTDAEQRERMVIGITFRGKGYYYYDLANGTSSSWHFEVEITDEKIIKK